METEVKTLLLGRIDAAEKRLAHVPCIVSNNKRMAIWSDIKEVLFLWCASQQCSAVLNALKHQLGYPATEEAMHPCTQLEQLMFLKQFVVVTPGTLLVDLSQIDNTSALMLMYDVVKMKHNHSKDPSIKQCNEIMTKLSENFSNTSIKIPLANFVRKKFIPAVKRTCQPVASKEVSGWVIPPYINVSVTRKHVKKSSQSDREESHSQQLDDRQLQAVSPIISSVVYSAGDQEASEALVPLSLLLAMFPVCQGYLEMVVQQFVLSRCDQEYLRSVCKCSVEEGIQLTRYLVSQQGYEKSWSCLTSCSVLISWADFWLGYTKSKDATRLLHRSSDISVVTLDCQGLLNTVPALNPTTQQPRGAKNLTFVETTCNGKQQYKGQGGLAHKPSETLSADGYKLAESQTQSRSDLKTSMQSFKLKGEQHNNKQVNCREKGHAGERTGPKNGKNKCSSKELHESKKLEKQKEKVKTGKAKVQSKERKSKNTGKVKGTSRTYVRVTRSSVNLCRADTNPHTDLEEQRDTSRKLAEKEEHYLQSGGTNLNDAKIKKYKKDSNNSAVLDDANNAKEGSDCVKGKKVLEKNCNQASIGCVKNDAENNAIEQGEHCASNENKDCGDYQNTHAIKDSDINDLKQEDAEKMEEVYTETEAYCMAGIEVSITPKKNKQSEISQTEESTAQNLLQLTTLGKKKGGYSVNLPERTVLKISPAKINDNLPIKLRLKKEYSSTPRSQSACSSQENSDTSYKDGGTEAEGNSNDKPSCVNGCYTPKYVSIVTKQFKLDPPTVSTQKKHISSEKFPYKSVRSQPDSGQKDVKAEQQSNISPTKRRSNDLDQIYPVIQGSSTFETLKPQRHTSNTTAPVSLPGPLNPVISNPLSPSKNLPDAIVKNLQEQASKSICSILGNPDAKMLETIQAEGKVIPVNSCKYTDLSNFQTDRINMWKRTAKSPEKGTGRQSKSADVHRKERTYTYRPSSSIYSYKLGKFETSSNNPSFKNALYAIYSRDKPESPNNKDGKCDKKKTPVMQTKTTKEKKSGVDNTIEYGSSSSKNPDIYDKFARKRKPRGTTKPDVSPMKAKIVGHTVPKPVQTSKPQESGLNNEQSVKEKAPQRVGNTKPAGQTSVSDLSTGKRKLDNLPQSGEPVQQRYSHMESTSLANLPYTSMMNNSSPSGKALPTEYPSCRMCRQSQEVLSDWRNFYQCVPPDSSNESICQSSTQSRIENVDSQCSFNDTNTKESMTHLQQVPSSTEDPSKPLSLLQKVDTFVDNLVSPKSSQSLENVENLAAFMNFNFLSDDKPRQQKGVECILEACQTSSYPFRHCKDCSSSDSTVPTANPADTESVLTEGRETIARVNSQLYFSNPGSSQLFKVSGDVTIPANAQFYVQTNLGECKEAFPNIESMQGLDRLAQATSSKLKETCDMFLDKTAEASISNEKCQQNSISEIFGEDTYKTEGVADIIENPFEFVEENEMVSNTKGIANQNEREGSPSKENEFQDKTLTVQDNILDTEDSDNANVEQSDTTVSDVNNVNLSPTPVSAASNELIHTNPEFLVQKEQKVDTLNDSVNQVVQDSSDQISYNDILNYKETHDTLESYRKKTPTTVKINNKSAKPDISFLEYVKETRAARKEEEEELRKKKFWASAQVQYLKRCQGSTYRPSRAMKAEPKALSKPVYKTLIEKPTEGSNKVKNTSPVKDTNERPRTTSGLRKKQNIQQKARPKTVPGNRSEDDIAEKTTGPQKVLPIKNDTLQKELSGKRINSRYGIGKNTVRPKTSPSVKVDRKTVPTRTVKSAKLKTEMPKSVREREKKVSTDAYQVASTLRRLSLENKFGLSDKKYETRKNKLHSFVRAEFDKVKLQEVQKPCNTEMSHVDQEMYNHRQEGSQSIAEHSVMEDELLPVETADQIEGEVNTSKREAFITQFNPRYIMDRSYTSYDLYNKILGNDTHSLQNQNETRIICKSNEYLNSNENNKISSDDTSVITYPEIIKNSSACDNLSDIEAVLQNNDHAHNSPATFINSLPVFSDENLQSICQFNVEVDNELAQSCDTMPMLEKDSTHNTVIETEEAVQHVVTDDNIGATISIDTSRSDGEDICLKLNCLDNLEYIIPSNHPSYISLMTFFQEQQLECVILKDKEQTHTLSRVQDNLNNHLLDTSDGNVTDVIPCEDDVFVTDDTCDSSVVLQDMTAAGGTDRIQYTNVIDATEPESEALYMQHYSSADELTAIEEQNTGVSVFKGDVDHSVAEMSDDQASGISDSDGRSRGTQNDEGYMYEWSCHTEDTQLDNSPQFDAEHVLDAEETVVPADQTLILNTDYFEQSKCFTGMEDNAYEITVYTESSSVDEENDSNTLQAAELHDFTIPVSPRDVDVLSDKFPEEKEYDTDEEESYAANGFKVYVITEDSSQIGSYADQKMKLAKYLNVDIDTRREKDTFYSNPRKHKNHKTHSECRLQTDINKELTLTNNVGDDLSLGAEAEITESTDSIDLINFGDKKTYEDKLKNLDNYSESSLTKDCSEMDYDTDDEFDFEVDVDDIKDEDYVPDETDEEDLGDIYDDVMKINKSLGKADDSKKSRFRQYSKILNKTASSKKTKKKYIDKYSSRKVKLKTSRRESRKSDTDSEDGFSSDSGSKPRFGSMRYEKVQYTPVTNVCFDESDSDNIESGSHHYTEMNHPKSKQRKNISRSKRKNDKNCQSEVEDKIKEKEAAKATKGFIKTQKIYFDIIKNSSLNSSSCEAHVSSRGTVGIDNVPSGIPVHGDRLITKAEADAEKALEGTGSLSDDSEAPQVIEDLANNCRYQLVEDEDHINLGGIAYFGDFALPFVYINGYKYTPLKDALTLFQPGHCVSKCTIPRNVVQKHKQVVKTFSTWDHVYKFELIKMKKGPAIKTGDMVVKLDSLFNTLPALVREIVRLHQNTKLKRSQDCDMTSYRNFKTSAVT